MTTMPPGSAAPPPPPPPRPARPPWNFVRRDHGKIFGGVATGMADLFNVHVNVVRVAWIVLAIISFGLGVAAYAICWIVFPSDVDVAPMHRMRRRDGGMIVAFVLLGLGLAIALSRPMRTFGDVTWATVLIVVGLAVLLLRDTHHDDVPTTPPSATWPPTAAGGADAPAAPPAGTTPGTPGPEAQLFSPGDAAPPYTPPPPGAWGTGGPTTTAWSQRAPWPVPPPAPRRPRRRAFLTPVTLSVLLVGGGIVLLLDDNGSAHLTAAEILAGALCVVGAALVLSTWVGRARGLVPVGIVLLLVTLPAAAIDVPITGGTGNRVYVPVTRADLRGTYELGIGRLDLDLTQVPLAGHTTHVKVRLGIGELIVNVPSTVRVVLKAHAGAGSLRLFGNRDGGWPDDATRTAPGTGRGELDLDARVGAGDVMVRRFEPDGTETMLRSVPTPEPVR